jgi:hypothetical protein
MFFSVVGIQDIRIGQYEELLREGFVCSYNFKTVGKFIQQPITTSGVVNTVLSTYVNSVRPAIRSKYKKKPTDMDHLFLCYEGRLNDRLGRLITQYFLPYSLHITSTTIRSLVETEANILKKRGDITATDFSSLQNIGGHSEKTSEEYYIKERTCDDISAGKRIFDQLELNRNHSLESGAEFEIRRSISENVLETIVSSPEAANTDSSGVSNTYIDTYSLSTPQQPRRVEALSGPSEVRRSLAVGTNSSESPLAIEHRPTVRSQSSTTLPSIIAGTTPKIWGRYHPNFNQPDRIRAVWSEAELNFLGHIVSELSDERFYYYDCTDYVYM